MDRDLKDYKLNGMTLQESLIYWDELKIKEEEFAKVEEQLKKEAQKMIPHPDKDWVHERLLELGFDMARKWHKTSERLPVRHVLELEGREPIESDFSVDVWGYNADGDILKVCYFYDKEEWFYDNEYYDEDCLDIIGWQYISPKPNFKK